MGNSIRRQLMANALKGFDLGLMVIAFGVGNLPVLAAIGPVSFTAFWSMKIKLQNFVLFFAFLAFWYVTFALMGLYDSKRLSSRMAEFGDVLKATTLTTLVFAAVAFVLRLQMLTPTFLVIFWAFTTVASCGSRLALRTWLKHLRVRGRNTRNVLIVGANRRAIHFAKDLQSKPELGYRLIGFADDEWRGAEEARNTGYPLVSDFAGLSNYIRRNVVDEVMVVLPIRSFHIQVCRIGELCEQQGITLRVLSDLFNSQYGKWTAEDFGGTTLISSYGGAVDGWSMVIKRIFDIATAVALLAVLSPLLLIIAIFIKLTSPGPALFVQKRVGFNKRTFDIYKFRTMVVNAEDQLRSVEHLNEVSGPVFKIRNDPRLTPIGKILRKTSIDELPQLFNVLKGDMSLVGPRPLQLRDYELFTNKCEDWQRCRFSVRPGITCLWQVHGRSSVPFEKWMELDLQYVRRWSLWLDLQILVKTIPAVLRGSGAA